MKTNKKSVISYTMLTVAAVSYVGILTKENETHVSLLTKHGEFDIDRSTIESDDPATREDFDNMVNPNEPKTVLTKSDLARSIFSEMRKDPKNRRVDIIKAFVAQIPNMGEAYANTLYQKFFVDSKTSATTEVEKTEVTNESTDQVEEATTTEVELQKAA